MNKYVAIVLLPDAWGQSHMVGGETVYEQEKCPIKTGIVNTEGVPIYRVPQQNQIGFELNVPTRR
jgi:hypothetical protein